MVINVEFAIRQLVPSENDLLQGNLMLHFLELNIREFIFAIMQTFECKITDIQAKYKSKCISKEIS
jgi:hypothetical protein